MMPCLTALLTMVIIGGGIKKAHSHRLRHRFARIDHGARSHQLFHTQQDLPPTPNFGVLNYAIALTGIFSIIASMSVEEIVIRQLVRHPERRARELGNFFMLFT
jgi:hypothetical protein